MSIMNRYPNNSSCGAYRNNKNCHCDNAYIQEDLNNADFKYNEGNNCSSWVKDGKNNSISCEQKKDKKYGCCCDTTKLRELLLVFSRNNTPIIIFTETLPTSFINQTIAVNYVQSVINDLVYVSTDSSTGPVIFIIPLCSISAVFVASTSAINGISEILSRIKTKKTLEKDECCCVSGIGNVLNSLSNISLLLPLTSGLLDVDDEFAITVLILFIFLLSAPVSIAANDDIYVLSSNGTIGFFYFIVPTCKIDALVVLQNLDAVGGAAISSTSKSSILNSLLPLLSDSMRAKVGKLDVDKFFDEVKVQSTDKIIEKINSMLRYV